MNKKDIKLGILEVHNGTVVQSQVLELDFSMSEYDVIPVEPDNQEYNRARVKRQTRKALEKYYEGEQR